MKNAERQLGLLCVITAIVAFSLTFMPMSFAEAKVRTGSHSSSSGGSTYTQPQHRDTSENNWIDSSNTNDSATSANSAEDEPEAIAGSIDDPSAFTRITDEATGITVSARTSETFNSDTDKSCFSIEVLSDNRETLVIKPCISVMGENEKIGLIIPIDPEQIGNTPKVYDCQSEEKEIVATVIDGTIRIAIPNQTPVKITYEAPSRNESNSTKINIVTHDDEPEGSGENEETDQDLIKRIAVALAAILVIASIVVILKRKQGRQ